jgi:hypothetical protein
MKELDEESKEAFLSEYKIGKFFRKFDINFVIYFFIKSYCMVNYYDLIYSKNDKYIYIVLEYLNLFIKMIFY